MASGAEGAYGFVTTRSGGGGERELKIRVKTGKSRTLSSKLWLERQLNDPYVARAKREGYRSRAAYKLLEIDDKYRISEAGRARGRSRRGARRLEPDRGEAHRCARTARAAWSPSTFSTWTPVPGVDFAAARFSRPQAPGQFEAACSAARPMWCSPTWRRTPPAIARPITSRSWRWSKPRRNSPARCWRPGGAFLAKVIQGGTEATLLPMLKRDFASVKHVKPAASRADSAELYVLATGFRGR